MSTIQELTIAAQVVFGSPSRNCAGSGVCKMLPITTTVNDTWHCPLVPVNLRWSSVGVLQLSLRLSDLSITHQRRWFAKPCFWVEERFVLPLWFSKYHQVRNWVIPPGHYAYHINRRTGVLQIQLVCQPRNVTSTLEQNDHKIVAALY